VPPLFACVVGVKEAVEAAPCQILALIFGDEVAEPAGQRIAQARA
jgi:hypothetical protein